MGEPGNEARYNCTWSHTQEPGNKARYNAPGPTHKSLGTRLSYTMIPSLMVLLICGGTEAPNEGPTLCSVCTIEYRDNRVTHMYVGA